MNFTPLLPLSLRQILTLALVFATSLSAQPSGAGRITGYIFNTATKQFVRNAEVAVEGTNIVAFSADNGVVSHAEIRKRIRVFPGTSRR